MFINNKYTKWYFEIINNGYTIKPNDGVYYERHHIIPKSLNGSDSKSNLIFLTARQHFICHLLLIKMTYGKQKRSMAFAYLSMKRSHGGGRKQNARSFEKFKYLAIEEMKGEKNPAYGQGHKWSGEKNPMRKKENYEKFLKAVRSEEHRKKMSKRLSGEKNPFYGKTHSVDARKKISKKRSKPVKVLFENGEEKIFNHHGDLGEYIGQSRAQGSKLCKIDSNTQKPLYDYMWSKYGIEKIERVINANS